MKEIKDKIKRLTRVKKIKEHQKSVIGVELKKMKLKQTALENLLLKTQDEYHAGVKHLNKIRESSVRKGAVIFNDAVEVTKKKWLKTFEKKEKTKLSINELTLQIHKIKKQLDKLADMQNSLKIEMLKEDDIKNQNHIDMLIATRLQRRES